MRRHIFPAVEKFLGNLFQEPAGRIVLDFAPQKARSGIGQRQVIFGPGNAHVSEPPLFLLGFFIAAVDGHVAGENPVLEAGQIDVRKFQSLGAVKRHQKDLFLSVLRIVQVGDQRHFLQKAGKRGLLGRLLIVGDLADQLVDVGDSVLSVLVVGAEKVIIVIRLFDDFPQKICKAVTFFVLPQLQDQTDEGLYFGSGAAQGGDIPAPLHGLEESNVAGNGVIGESSDGGQADSPPGDVQDTPDGDLVLSVLHRLEIGDHVADLSAVVEVGAAHHVVRDARENKALFQRSGLGVCPVEHGKIPVAQMPVVPALGGNVVRHKGRLVSGCPELAQMDLRALALVRPQGLLLAPRIVADHGVGRVQHVLGGPVVLLQFDHVSVRINFFKIQNVADIGTPEAVDGLVVVAYDAQIPVLAGQQADQFELGVVGVLVLVHHDIAEAVLVRGQNLVVGVEQLHGLHQKVVKIQRVVLFQPLLVFFVGIRDAHIAKAESLVFLSVLERRSQLVLCRGDLAENLPLPKVFGVDLKVFAHLLHQCFLVVRVVDGKGGLIAQIFDVAAQDSHAHGVEGGDPDALGAKADQLVDALPHLSRRLIGESDGKNVPGIDPALVHEIGDPVRDHSGLAAPGSRQDQNRAFGPFYGLRLLFI